MTTIFYFSATGNSFKAATDIANYLGDSEVLSISKEISKDCTYKSENIGIVFPVYVGGIPNMVRRFIEKLKVDTNAYIFAVGTCGAFAGKAFYEIAEALKANNLKLSYYNKLNTVANYIVLYNPRADKANEIVAKSDTLLKPILADIKAKTVYSYPKKPGLLSRLMPDGRAVYTAKDKNFNVNDNCIGCRICSKVCPAHNIEMKDKKPSWLHNCEHCMACIHWCPNEAINYTNKTQGRNRYHNPGITEKQMELWK